MTFCCAHDLRVVTAQEYIARQFAGDVERNTGTPVGKFGTTRGDRRITRLDGMPECEIGTGVFVAAEHQGARGQTGDALQGCEQARRFAFEDSTAACTEQGVADEDRVIGKVGDVAAGMAGNMPHLERREAGYVDSVAVVDELGDVVDARVARSVDRAGMSRRQRRQPTDVISMVVGDENGAQAQVQISECAVDRGIVARVEHDGVGAGLQQPEVVVDERRDVVRAQTGKRGRGDDGHEQLVLAQCAAFGRSRACITIATCLLPSARMPVFSHSGDSGPQTDSWWQRLLAAERAEVSARTGVEDRTVWLAAVPSTKSGDELELYLRGDRQVDGALRAEAGAWPLRDDSVDRIVLQHVVEMAADADALLDEAMRVLKPERSIVLLVVGAWSFTRFKTRWLDTGAPRLQVPALRDLCDALSTRDCVDLRVSRIAFQDGAQARITVGARPWSGLLMIEARKRRELPNSRRAVVRQRVTRARAGWVARPSSRSGNAA